MVAMAALTEVWIAIHHSLTLSGLQTSTNLKMSIWLSCRVSLLTAITLLFQYCCSQCGAQADLECQEGHAPEIPKILLDFFILLKCK